MDTLKRYEVLQSDDKFVIFRDRSQSGYEPPMCHDRKTGKFFGLQSEAYGLGREGLGIEFVEG